VDSDGYDCQTCGACCAGPPGGGPFVYLAAAEAVAARRLRLPVVTFKGEEYLGVRPAAAGGGSVCRALAGTVGGACSCTIYPARPGVCRAFEAGSIACRAARREAGLPE
jgi:Fe-S-cluster containining protein